MWDRKEIAYSPSGKYACRVDRSTDNFLLSTQRQLLFFDLQAETIHSINVVVDINHKIYFLYWLDETHVAALFNNFYRSNKKQPQRALYEVDLKKQTAKTMNIVYWGKDVMRLPMEISVDFSNGFVTVNGHEYIVYTQIWYNQMPEDEKKHFNDIENFEWFNGNKEDYTCLRFIPKGFQNEPEMEKVYLNHGEVCRVAGNLSDKHFFLHKITAHKDKLFLNFNPGRLILVHLNEYFEALKENTAKPSSFEFCEAVKLPGGMPHETPMYFRNGFFYLQARDEDLRIYTRIWDVDENTFTSYFKVDLKSAFPAGFLFPCRTLHPSGHFLQIDAVTVHTKFVDSCLGDYVVYKTKKSLRFKLIPLIPTEGHSSEQLALDQNTLEKSRSHGIVPRFVEDGRNQLTFPTKGLYVGLIRKSFIWIRRYSKSVMSSFKAKFA